MNEKRQGFTLLEVMSVIVIISILAAIVLPSYQRYILRSHRVDARNMLQEAAQRMEQNFSISRTYNATNSGVQINNKTLTTWGLNRSPASGNIRYNISFSAITAQGYTLQAVPAGTQQNDTDCMTFTINNQNVKTAKGQSGRSPVSIRCWSS